MRLFLGRSRRWRNPGGAASAAVAILAVVLFDAPAARAAPASASADDLVLRVAGRTAVVLARATRTVYRYELPAAPPEPGARRLASVPVVVAGPELLTDPVAVAIDAAGVVYIADAGNEAAKGFVQVARRDAKPEAFPIAIVPAAIEAGADGRVLASAEASATILSIDLKTGRAVTEFSEPADGPGAGRFTALLRSGGVIWAFDAAGRQVLRLFEAPRRSPLDLSARSVRGGEAVGLRDPLPPGSGVVAVAGDVLYSIDRRTHRLAAVTLGDPAPVSLDYRAFARQAVAIAADGDSIYFVDPALRLFRVPRLVPASAYFEAGTPSENAIAFCEYLADRNTLPVKTHVLEKGDVIAKLVTATNLLPGAYPDKPFEALFCRLNAGFCQDGKVPALYYPGQRVLLPDVNPTRYVARRAVTLPVDATKFPAIPARHGTATVADISGFYAPLTAADSESLRAVVSVLNYTYQGPDLLAETRGTFVLPVDAVKMTALVPARDVIDRRSDLNRLRSRNLTIAAAAGPVPAPQSLAVAAADEPALGAVVPEPDARCEAYDPKTYRRPQALINYCVPAEYSGPVHVAIVDNLFDPTHQEFADGRLKPFAADASNATRKPLTDAYSTDFDEKIDHGTHVAAIMAARNARNEVAGVHPRVILNAVSPVKAKELLDTITSLNICSISLGQKPGTGAGAGLPPELKTLVALVQDPSYQNVLFVIAAGNEAHAVGKGMFAELGAQNNVIVVGAAAWAEAGPLLASYSNRGAPFVSIVAPGNLIRSATYGGGYGVASGTSQATAFVTGTAALLRSGAGAAWAPWQIKERLLSTADLWLHGRNDSDAVFSGMLNMKRALFDAGVGVFVRDNDRKNPIKGHIAAEDREKVLVVAPAERGAPAVFVRLGDLRRLERNDDGTRTIIYSVRSGASDYTRHLERLLDVAADRLRWNGAPGPLTFTVERLDGTSAAIDLEDLWEFVNEVS